MGKGTGTPKPGTPPKVKLGSLGAADILRRSLDVYQKKILALSAPLPAAKAVITRSQRAGDLLLRLVDLRESPHASLDELFAVRGEMAAELKARGIDHEALEMPSMEHLIVVLEEWASNSLARAAEFTSVELAHAARREAFLGHLVQHLLLRHRVIGPALRGLAKEVAARVGAGVQHGGQAFLTGLGIKTVPPKGVLGKPKLGRDVEFWDGEKWAAATDFISYSEHLDATTGKTWGHHWLLEIETKKGHVTTKQFRDRADRLAATPLVRWVDVETGLHVHQTTDRILVNTEPATRILMVGDLPAKYKTDYLEFGRMRGPQGWEQYLRWDARMKLDVVEQLYELVR